MVVTVNDIDEAPIFPTGQSATVKEHTEIGQTALTLTATDPEEKSLSFTLDSITPHASFGVEPSGRVYVTDALNFEGAHTSFTLTVKACDPGGKCTTVSDISITLSDEPDAPTFDAIPTKSVSEAAVLEALVTGVVKGLDEDAGQEATLTHKITGGNKGNAFEIDGSTGQIKVTAELNHEETPTYELYVTATDSDNLSVETKVQIDVTDEPEAPFFIDADDGKAYYDAKIAASTSGSYIGFQLLIGDPDKGQDSGACSITNDASGRFEFVSQSPSNACVLTISDGELLPADSTHDVTVRVTGVNSDDNTLYSEIILKVLVEGVNTPPICTSASFSIPENSPENTLVGVVRGSPEDADQKVTFSFKDGNTNEAFGIDSSTGTISVSTSTALDFESDIKTFTINIGVQDDGPGNMEGSCQVVVTITDVDEAPTCSPVELSVAENVADGLVGHTIDADCTDVDAGDSTFKFELLNHQSVFKLHSAATGELRTIKALDYENIKRYEVSMRVIDANKASLTSEFIQVVTITDANDPPHVSIKFVRAENDLEGLVLEHTNVRDAIGSVIIDDQDEDDVLTAQIETTDVPFELERQDKNTFRILLTDHLDFESKSEYSISILASDDQNAQDSIAVTIKVVDENERPLIPSQQTFFVSETAGQNMIAKSRYLLETRNCDIQSDILQTQTTTSRLECQVACSVLLACVSGVFKPATGQCILSSKIPHCFSTCGTEADNSAKCELFQIDLATESSQALDFTSPKMAVYLSAKDYDLNDFTIELWANLRQDTVSATLIALRLSEDTLDAHLSCDKSKIYMNILSAQFSVSLSIIDDKWHHIAWMRTSTSGKMQLFVDGHAIFTEQLPSSTFGVGLSNQLQLLVGLDAISCTCPTASLYGAIDEVS